MVYQHFSQLGSEIRINFPGSDGLIPGESVIKFRDVSVGKIVRIELQEGGDGVTVIARMNKEAEAYLNKSTRFWIVAPQVDYSGVRGLDTLLHGAYITMYASRRGQLITEFTGLEKPYRGSEEGQYVYLCTRKLGNVHVGAPVYYHNLRAGSIEKIALGADQRKTEVTIFIRREYVDLINVTTKFWHQNLVAVNMDGGKIALDLAPITSVLLGSISFESKLDKPYPKPGRQHRFRLYSRHANAVKKKIGGAREQPRRFGFDFSGRINGLHEGAPIRYQGFDVGEVETVPIRYNATTRMMEAVVTGTIDVSIFDDPDHNGSVNLARAVQKGLHAELKNSNPFVESLYIDLVYPSEQNGSTGALVRRKDLVRFPTHKVVKNTLLSQFDRLLSSITALTDANREPLRKALESLKTALDNINRLTEKPSFQSLSDDLNTTLRAINGFTGDGGDLSEALRELQKTLRTTKNVMRGYSSGSLFGKKLDAMLKEIGQTSEETKRLIEKLNKKPNALIFGE
jgi:paraquat-inducible protein B